MISFKDLMEKKMKGEDPCWDSHEMIGMKKGKGGKPVPNCVPKEEYASDAQRKAVWASRNEKGIKEEQIEEVKIPVEHAVKAVTRVLGSQSAARFATHLKPGTEKHTTWDRVNTALKNQGVKPQHIADIAVHVRPAQYEEVEIDEAKGELTYKPEHAKWGVVPKSSKEFVKFFPKDKEADARAHVEKTGGTLKKIDQAGRAMREEVEIDESSESKKGISVRTRDDTHDVVNSSGKVVKQFHKTPKGLEYAHQYVKQNKGNTGLEEQDSKHFEIYDTKTSKAVHSFKANHMSHANIKADDWLESNGKTGKGLKVRPAKQSVAEGLGDSNTQEAIVDTVERLFRKNNLSDYGALEAIRQGVKHHFSKPGATAESAIEGILNILDKRMSKSGNYVDLGRFKEALRQGVAHQMKKQGVTEGSDQELVNRQVSYWDQVAKEKKNKERDALKARKAEHEKTPIGKAEKYWSEKGVAEELELEESMKTHYQNGYDAQKKGKTRQDNPHREGTLAASMWAKGWEHSSDKKEPQKFTNEEVEEVTEGGQFSYGAKAPRKGSVAYHAMMKRKEQEKNKPPIEPKDQMVGTAKVLRKDDLDESIVSTTPIKRVGYNDIVVRKHPSGHHEVVRKGGAYMHLKKGEKLTNSDMKDMASNRAKFHLEEVDLDEAQFWGNKDMTKQADNASGSTTTMRGKDSKGVYTATLVRKKGESEHKEVSRVYDTKESTWPGHSSTVKNPNFNDELSGRRVSPIGNRLKSGKLDYAERTSQERLKALMQFKKARGGLTGPKGTLPEEVEDVTEGFTDDMPADSMVGTMDKIRGGAKSQRYHHLQKLLKQSKNPKTIAQTKALLSKEFPQGVAEEVELEEAVKKKLVMGSKVSHPIHGRGTVVSHSLGGGTIGTVVKFSGGKKLRVDHKKLRMEEVEDIAEGQSSKPIKPGDTFRFPNHWNKADVVHEFLRKKNAVVDVAYSYDTKKWTVIDSRPAIEKDMKQWATINAGLPRVNEQGVTEGFRLPRYEYGKITPAYKLAKEWLKTHGTNGYDYFDYPKYAGMPKSIANKLSTDEVDFIQKYWNKQGVAEEIELDELRNVTQDKLGIRMGSGSPGYNKTPEGKARELKRRQEHLKGQMKFTKSQGGIPGPKGKLPEEVESVEEGTKQQLPPPPPVNTCKKCGKKWKWEHYCKGTPDKKQDVAEGTKQQLPVVSYKEISPAPKQGRDFFKVVKSESPLWKVGETFSDDDMSMGSRQVRFVSVSVKRGVAEETELSEAHKIGSRVEIIKGSAKGIKGHIGEIRSGAYHGAPKTYTVYHGEQGAVQVPKEHIRAIKEESVGVAEGSDMLSFGEFIAK